MHQVGTVMTSHFKGQTSPKSCIPPVLTIIVFYSLPSLLFMGISKIKNAKFHHGHPLRPCRCTRLSHTTISSHFQGQICPEASIPPILTIIVCHSSPSLLVIEISKVKMLKFVLDYTIGWTSRPCRPILMVKQDTKCV